MFLPKLFSVIAEGYRGAHLRKDLIAGLIVGVLAIPISIAFAIASGARPEQGLITAVVAGFIAALTSGSRFQVTGPTGAFVILVHSTIAQYGYQGMVIATFIAGLLLIVGGLTRVGAAIKFIPYSVTVGFTSGIALLIATSQFPDLLGIPLHFGEENVFTKWVAIASHLTEAHFATVAVALISLFLLWLWPKFNTPVPGSLVVIFVSTLLVKLLALETTTIGDRFGTLTFSLPMPSIPIADLGLIPNLIQPAMAIALLAGIESLLSAVVADGMTARRHRSHMELISQGLANIASGLMGGIPATGAIARTATNIKSGAVSPIASITHAGVILFSLAFLGPAIAQIPMASLAAVLLFIAYHMSEWRHFMKILRCPAGDIVILLVTFLLTVLVDLVTAIEVGIIVAAFITIHRMADASGMKDLRQSLNQEEQPEEVALIKSLELPAGVEVFEIYGSLFFAATEKFLLAHSRLQSMPKVLILRMGRVMTLDASGVRLLYDFLTRAKATGCQLMISDVSHHGALFQKLKKAGLVEDLGADHVVPTLQKAVEKAKTLVAAG